MAPAAQIYAYKVCSSVSTSCSGEAMVLAMERAADPNQNGSTLDHTDALNMSIGSPYGLDIVTNAAVNAAVDVGIAAAVSAGNSSNIPFITGAPGEAAKALSVASSVSSGHNAYNLVVNTPVTLTQPIMPFVVQPWGGPITPSVTANLIEARTVVTFTAQSARLGCTQPGNVNPFPPDSLTGKIAVVDRGVCAISQKAHNAEGAGAVAMILVMLPGQEPTVFSSGGESVTIPTIAMSNADMAPLRAHLAAGGTVNATIGMNSPISLADTLSGFTSRGPGPSGAFKPDISAPGQDIVSTAAGTGTEGVDMSGTSMAAPHVAGALAQMKQYHPTWSALELEALLVNSSVPTLTVGLDPRTRTVAPLSLAGAGRLAVDRAAALDTTVMGDNIASISFGRLQLASVYTASKTVHINNHSDLTKSYNLSVVSQFTQSPALHITVSPATLSLEPGASGTATVTIVVDPSLLPTWNLYGSGMNSPANLTASEMAGWVVVHDNTANQTARAPWYVLPRKASEMHSADESLSIASGVTTKTLTLNNTAAYTGTAQIYNLMGEDPMESLTQTVFMPQDIKSVGVRSMQVSVSGTLTDVVDFGLSTYGLRTVPVQAEFDVNIDTNRDGTPDFVVFNGDLGYLSTGSFNGQHVVLVYDIANDTLSTSGFYVATGIDTTNLGMTVPMAMLGMTAGQAFDFYVQGYEENAYGNLIDEAPNTGHYTFDTGHMRFTPATYTATAVQGTPTTVSVRCDTSATDSEKGLLLLYQYNMPTWGESQAVYIGPFNFSDVSSTDWFYQYVEYVSLRGIANGYADGTFRPYANATRGQIAKMVVLGMNLPIVTPATPTFSDVPAGSAFYSYVETAAHFGIVSGYSDHTFRPNNDVTRGQIAKMVISADVLTAGWELMNPATPTFSDVPTTNPFYTYIETASAHGVISGYGDGTFRWGNNATRSQVAKMINLAASNR
jgi:subtilisin family serine protease